MPGPRLCPRSRRRSEQEDVGWRPASLRDGGERENGQTGLCDCRAHVLLPVVLRRTRSRQDGHGGSLPPYNFINDEGEVDGFERELGDELCLRADLECVWVTNEWDAIIPNLVEGKYDTIMAGMSITDERDEVIDFTQPYIPPSASVYVALAGAGDGAVAGRVAAQVSTIQADYLSESGATLVVYELAEDVFSAVLRGEADATLVDIGFAHEYMAKSGEGLAIVGPQVMLDAGTGIGVRESDGALKDKLDRTIDAMKQDGSLNALIEKWFGPDAETF